MMPDRSLTVATYAAGASLAAITLIYVFGPTYFLDSDPSATSGSVFSPRKNGVVGLSNPANDCFINSVLQALAGLGDLRLYLIRETYRRTLDNREMYSELVPASASLGREKNAAKNMPEWKVEGLQMGIVTRGLKDILDKLNERPIYKKTISAVPFVRTLEQAFRQKISRQQQDAQEFLQVVAERLCDEYHAGRRVRDFVRRKPIGDLPGMVGDEEGDEEKAEEGEEEDEEGFPLEGKFESQIECLTCGFKPRPTESTFCSLTLNVPQASATTLNACFDGMFKTEYIEDFKCEKCRLVHAMSILETEIRGSKLESAKSQEAMAAMGKLQVAIDTDPERLPEDVALPDIRYAPKRKIARHIRLTRFPKVLAVHLSRSIFDASSLSHKNSAKVAFPEVLPLGGLLQQRKYRLLGLVTHKGSHHSGHYESFRRQTIYPPFSNPNTFQASGPYSKAASLPSTPPIKTLRQATSGDSSPSVSATPVLLAGDPATNSFTPSLALAAATSTDYHTAALALSERRPSSSHRSRSAMSTSGPKDALEESTMLSVVSSTLEPSSDTGSPMVSRDELQAAQPPLPKAKRRKPHDRWWRISDEKVKEATTRDVLSMQREVYLLFYELEKTNHT
ncbi:hypothetical protein B0H63DRAFT_477092 [Podospora didyma]|uniref:Ubiquitin carboxyl-terminal hydrolase n=1 Tax=Podospora didyma TaxID=330526 RepID=A0AAE0TWI6_9PEZI|nr:hypothetical protein B0H63DRAFT_477092 [Podospora didyma]